MRCFSFNLLRLSSTVLQRRIVTAAVIFACMLMATSLQADALVLVDASGTLLNARAATTRTPAAVSFTEEAQHASVAEQNWKPMPETLADVQVASQAFSYTATPLHAFDGADYSMRSMENIAFGDNAYAINEITPVAEPTTWIAALLAASAAAWSSRRVLLERLSRRVPAT